MSYLRGIDHPAEDLTKELASNLPRWIGWIPTAFKAARRGVARWKQARKTEYQVTVRPVDARIDVRATDQATIDFSLSVSNFSKRVLEPDRLELGGISVGGRNLQRNSEMMKVRGEISARSAGTLWVTIDLHGSDVQSLLEGITKASNPLSSPQASVRLYGEILFLAGSERFRKSANFQWDWASCNVPSGLQGRVS